jgi:thiamine pyrophosphate-dependent acetolactate synthase large subunit-like protein
MMHIQELETIRRQGIRILIAVMNDGGYGAEFHKFRANDIDESQAVHGRGDLSGVAKAFGLRGAKVDQCGRFSALFNEHQSAGGAELWDVHVDDQVASRSYRRVHFGEA